MTKKTISQLKKLADKHFSYYIRQKDKDWRDNNTCYTCAAVMNWKKLQCGHYISRTHSITRYDENNVRPQCGPCNIWRRGNYPEFSARLVREIGIEAFDRLVKRGRLTHKFTARELENIIEKYKKKLKEL